VLKRLSENIAPLNILCVVLMVLLLVLQFLPFWSYGEPAETASISDYIWWPEDHKSLEKHMQGQFGKDFHVWEIVGMPCGVLAFGVLGILFCLIKPRNPLCTFLPLACGGIGLWGYLCKPAFQLGVNWQLHAALCALIFVVAACTLLLAFKDQIASAFHREN